ncbi:unnamed protein product [Ambrosiozyma monospora]|uniref:Unnamed protein product n=1 Tax=Ambrosiozyma monospora TaxID=43982 RepID=A0ACB5TW15_AMBMO|nr:unnamed protein product [Ambrosiozyma monospora]
MPTNTHPDSLKSLLIAYGIILGPFGSHSLFPALKSDMAEPEQFKKCLKVTYGVGFFADATMALAGFAMFGIGILNEVTKSVVLTEGYPKFVYPLVSILISMVPLAKTPINALPIINIAEFMCGITPQQLNEKGQEPTFKDKFLAGFIRVCVNFAFLVVAIIYPEFDRIIGISGASLCSIICVILPCGFYVRLCDPPNKWFYYTVMVLGGIVGTAATIANLI